MKKLLLVLLLVAPLAQAEHHRGHAIKQLEGFILFAGQIDDRARGYARNCHLNNADAASVDVILNYSSAALNRGTLALNMLYDPLADLDEILLLLNQPADNTTPMSATKRISGVLIRSRMLLPNACQDGLKFIARMQQSIEFSWRFLDRAIWHVNDAIREEVYRDHLLVCAGPNNHCECKHE